MKSAIQIVSEKDEVIGHKHRDELDLKKDIYRVSALWLTNSEGDVLIAQRALTKNNAPGVWGPAVAGTVEEGETYEINIYKEAEEEIGLTGHRFTIGPKVFNNGPRNYFTQWFTVAVDEPVSYFKIQLEEVERVRWIPMSELVSEVKDSPEKFTTNFPSRLKLFSREV